jgi:hypothetical protein
MCRAGRPDRWPCRYGSSALTVFNVRLFPSQWERDVCAAPDDDLHSRHTIGYFVLCEAPPESVNMSMVCRTVLRHERHIVITIRERYTPFRGINGRDRNITRPDYFAVSTSDTHSRDTTAPLRFIIWSTVTLSLTSLPSLLVYSTALRA